MSSKSTFSNSTSKSYAFALYEISKENSELDKIEIQMKSLNLLLKESHDFKEMLLNRVFVGYCLTSLISYGVFFSWFVTGPALLIHALKLSPVAFGWVIFICGGVAMLSAAIFNAKKVSKLCGLSEKQLTDLAELYANPKTKGPRELFGRT